YVECRQVQALPFTLLAQRQKSDKISAYNKEDGDALRTCQPVEIAEMHMDGDNKKNADSAKGVQRRNISAAMVFPSKQTSGSPPSPNPSFRPPTAPSLT